MKGDDLLGTAVASQAAFDRRLSWIRKHVGKRFGEVRIKESQIEESLSKMMDDATELKNLGSHMEFMTVLTEDSEQQHIIQMLLDSGAGLASMNHEGETLLHLAIVSVGRLEQLSNSGLGVFNINARDVKGRTPLHYVLAIGNISSTSFCLQHGADIDARDFNGLSAMHFSVLSSPCQTLLLEKWFDANVTDNQGRTPLHYAALVFASRPSVGEELRQAGADETILDNLGLIAEEYSRINSRNPLTFAEMWIEMSSIHRRYKLSPVNISVTLAHCSRQRQRDDNRDTSPADDMWEEWWLVSDEECSDNEAKD